MNLCLKNQFSAENLLKILICNLKNCDKLSLSIKCYESFFAQKSNEYSQMDVCLGAIATNIK